MSEPENGWLQQVSGELRDEVPVRAAWRARLLDEIARSQRPRAGDAHAPVLSEVRDEPDGVVVPMRAGEWRRPRRLVLRPLAGVAAALAFATLGAGVTLVVMSARGDDAANPLRTAIAPTSADAPARTARPVSDATSDRAMVRFELAAPTAMRVSLVGSFNRWNPVATPLERDPSTGKWMVSLRLPAGRHVYAFVVDGDVTADPAAPRTADADFGAPNSVVLVSGRSS